MFTLFVMRVLKTILNCVMSPVDVRLLSDPVVFQCPWVCLSYVVFRICKEPDHLPRACALSGLYRRCKEPGHVARECGQAGGQSRPSSSVPVPVPVPVPDDLVSVSAPDPIPVLDPDPFPVPFPATGSEDDGDMSSVSSDHPDPPVPDPDPVLPYPSLTVEDIPRRPRTKHTKRLAQPTTAFPFSSP